MMKPEMWTKRIRSGLNVPRGNIRATTGSIIGEYVHARKRS